MSSTWPFTWAKMSSSTYSFLHVAELALFIKGVRTVFSDTSQWISLRLTLLFPDHNWICNSMRTNLFGLLTFRHQDYKIVFSCDCRLLISLEFVFLLLLLISLTLSASFFLKLLFWILYILACLVIFSLVHITSASVWVDGRSSAFQSQSSFTALLRVVYYFFNQKTCDYNPYTDKMDAKWKDWALKMKDNS